mmetsp:Transcript_22645/g.25203  ORF Transcript_22645/g.25203 Transcript_22645/m.25203 type:complete len:133 (-) Transcript_22645:87-485(-)
MTSKGEYHVRVRLMFAENLPNMDITGDSDPYCKVYFGQNKKPKLTSVIDNTNRPIWNETVADTIKSADKLWVEVFDKDRWNPDDFMGRTAPIRFDSLKTGNEHVAWYDLLDEKCKKKPGLGRIRIGLELHQG